MELAAQKKAEEESRMLRANPLLLESAEAVGPLKRRWDDEVVFKSQSKHLLAPKKQSDTHRRISCIHACMHAWGLLGVSARPVSGLSALDCTCMHACMRACHACMHIVAWCVWGCVCSFINDPVRSEFHKKFLNRYID